MDAQSFGEAPPDFLAPDSEAAEQEQQLAHLRAELEEYQDLIEELPGIYEAKCRHQLRDVAQDIHNLMEERHRLQKQINRCLQADQESPHAAALAGTQPRETFTAPSHSAWRLRRLSSWQWALAAGVGAIVLAVFAGLLLRARTPKPPGRVAATPDPPAAPVPAESRPAQAPSGQPKLQLRANDDVWLELRSPDNSLVFVSTLKPGQQLAFPFQDGMRLRSGRPHQLEVALNGQPFKPLGIANDFSWRTLRLPERPRGADPETRTSDQPS